MERRALPDGQRPARPRTSPLDRRDAGSSTAAAVLDLQRHAGNRAVALLFGSGVREQSGGIRVADDQPVVTWSPALKDAVVQRDVAGRPPIYRDITKVPLKQLEAELASLTKALGKVSPKSARAKELTESRDVVRGELERRGTAPRIEAARAKLDVLERQVGVGLDALKFTYKLGAEHYLGSVEKNLAGFDERNRRAYAKVEKILAEAEADEKLFQKIRDAMLGIAIGAGVGLAADKIWDGAKGVWKVVWEVAGEVASWGVGEAVDATLLRPGSEWQIPPAMNPDKVALAETAKLLGAWKGLALTNASAATAGDVLRKILWARRLLEGAVTDKAMSFVTSYLNKAQAANIGVQLVEGSISQRASMAAFQAGSEYRLGPQRAPAGAGHVARLDPHGARR